MKKKETFEKLFKTSQKRLYNVAYSVVRDRELAHDVLQDAYKKAWSKFDEYDPNRKFINWMTSIVRNTGIDITRSRNRKDHNISLNTINQQMTQNMFDIEDTSSDPHKIYIQKELIEEIHSMIINLPYDLKMVMEPFLNGMTYTDIATDMNLKVNIVRARIHRAKQILKKNAENSKNFNF